MAVHAVVLAALSGERDVVTGYVAPGGRVLPCRLTTEPGPWRSVVDEAARSERELLDHADFPVDDLRRELGVAGPSFTTVFDPAGDGDLADGAVLRWGWSTRAAGRRCGCGTGPTCSTRTARPGSPATTSPRSR